MSSARRAAVASVLCILTASSVFAASRAPRQRATAAAAPVAATRQTAAPMTRAALMARFESIRVAERDAIRALQARIAATRDPVLLFALEMEVEHVKRDSEIDLLRAQVDYHRAAGNPEVAGQIESVIRQMTAPPVTGEPSARPAPETESR